MNNLQEQGRACYKREEYGKAIELFARAIGRSPSVQLLDNRAACYEKLADYSTALKDAKKAIQLHREDAVGYLRAGRLLMKMEKPSVALEIYTHGLKCIKHVGQGYEQLRKVHKELMDQLCPPKSVDPLTMLPRELAETILEYISFRQRMSACLVSKGWAQFIRASPNLWRHLDLSGARRKVRTAFVSRAINTAQKKLKAATLNHLYDFDKTLCALAKHCQLEELTLLECGQQGKSLTTDLAAANNLRALEISQHSPLTSHELGPLLAALSDRLETFECTLASRQPPTRYFAVCPKLRSLSLTFEDGLDHRHLFQNIAGFFPTLESLRVFQSQSSNFVSAKSLQECKKLKHLVFHIGEAHQGLLLPPTLTTLDLGSCASLPTDCELPLLQELSLKRDKLDAIEDLLSGAPNNGTFSFARESHMVPPSSLRALSILESACISTDLAQLLQHPRLKALEALSFPRCVGLDDEGADIIASAKLVKLRTVDLTAADVTGIGVKALVQGLSLETLVLNDCRNVSPDAVEWARSKGVTVKYRMNSGNTKGGRKVRY